MRGRKPTPTPLKLVTGNPGKRAINKHEPQPEGALETAPAWLSPEQKAIWDEALADAPLDLLRKLDAGVFLTWVVAKSLHQQATQQVNKYGMLTKTPKTGEPMQNPFLPIINRQAGIMMKAAAEMGFTPSSRSRIVLAPKAGGDEWDDF